MASEVPWPALRGDPVGWGIGGACFPATAAKPARAAPPPVFRRRTQGRFRWDNTPVSCEQGEQHALVSGQVAK